MSTEIFEPIQDELMSLRKKLTTFEVLDAASRHRTQTSATEVCKYFITVFKFTRSANFFGWWISFRFCDSVQLSNWCIIIVSNESVNRNQYKNKRL